MRLLRASAGHGFEITKDFDEGDIPPYVILSHTWGADEEEVTFADVIRGTGTQKRGYRKLTFCADRAREDGQTYFWVDTCCIDKSNSVELNTAITSMYRWYANAIKCYVFLSDVPGAPSRTENGSNGGPHTDFHTCRWFTRGWTLQELLAPKVVELYDQAGNKIGDKISLERHICEVTGIPAVALRGRALSSFSREERFSWQRGRRTKKPEDEAYSLMGICGTSMVPIYGEGRDRAMARLRKAIDEELQEPKSRDFIIPFSDTGMTGVEDFVGREDELEKIHTALIGDGSRCTIILHGLGGIGKTQLAIAYAKRHKDNYSAVFWFNIRDEVSIKQSFTVIAERIWRYHPLASHISTVGLAGNQDDVVRVVLAWLSEHNNTRWLAIYDNYDNPKVPSNTDPAAVDIRHFLPDAFQGSVIITTRSSEVKLGKKLLIRKLSSMQESVEILSNTSGKALSVEDPDVTTLVRNLDGLPLALATTGAYLEQANISITTYLRLYETSWSQLHKDDLGLETYEDRTLYSTWQISFERIQQQNELAAKLLSLWCYFSNQDLWYELLRDGDAQSLPWLRDLTDSLPVFIKAVRLLCNYSLAERETLLLGHNETSGYSIHACVHAWTMHALNKQFDETLAKFAFSAVDATQIVIGDCLHEIARLFYHLDEMQKAEQIYVRALQGKEEALGPKHPSTLRTVNNLGVLYRDQGRMREAEEMYLRALQGKEEALGLKHTSTFDTVNNLGVLYRDQGRIQEAEEMYAWVIQGKEEVLGPKHTSTLRTVNNLGVLYRDQGRMQEAEEMYLRALQGYGEVLGPKHTLTLDTINNLGNLYRDQGQMQEAEEMYIRALQGCEEVLGPKHTSTLNTVNNLGVLYSGQGRVQEAEEMYLRALQGREEVLGPKHMSTLDTIHNLGMLYSDQERMREAEEMFVRALQGKEEALGPKHASTLATVYKLGKFYKAASRTQEAHDMFARALAGYQEVEGDHTDDIDYLQAQLSAPRVSNGSPNSSSALSDTGGIVAKQERKTSLLYPKLRASLKIPWQRHSEGA